MKTTMNENLDTQTPRRSFLGMLATGLAGMGLLSLPSSLKAESESAENTDGTDPNEAWFKQIKGKHKIVFDVTQPHDVLPFAWPKVFLISNEKTGTPTKDCSVVVVLRHEGIPYAFDDKIWAKYKFGELFKADDPKTKAPSTRNPFWQPKPGDFSVPGIGPVEIGINQLQAQGVMFCVCDMAMTVYSAVAAMQGNTDAAEVKKDWMTGLLPGIHVMPSGLWALGRAQEHGCTYTFAG